MRFKIPSIPDNCYFGHVDGAVTELKGIFLSNALRQRQVDRSASELPLGFSRSNGAFAPNERGREPEISKIKVYFHVVFTYLSLPDLLNVRAVCVLTRSMTSQLDSQSLNRIDQVIYDRDCRESNEQLYRLLNAKIIGCHPG